MQLGPFTLPGNLFVAPMAGITDQPFRQLCRGLGAAYAVSEMVSANPKLWETRKSRMRTQFTDDAEPRVIQITGADPEAMALCAAHYVGRGAQIIDINMACPAKKVCNNWCGSALLRDERRVADILEAVVGAVDVPVTLKYRTGWSPESRNAVAIARMAESIGIAMLVLHGRTREDFFTGEAEYATTAEVKEAVSIPVVANGDIDSPQKAKEVLEATRADAIMIGRAARGRPWIFREISHYLQTGELLPPPSVDEIQQLIHQHLQAHYAFYGEAPGVMSARKHIGWYIGNLPDSEEYRVRINMADSSARQLEELDFFFESQRERG